MKKGPPALLVGAVLLWIAYDVGSGAMRGVERVEQQRLDETPMSEIVERAVAAHSEKRDGLWTEYATVNSIRASGADVFVRLMLTEKAESKIGRRMTQAEKADISHDLRDEVCRYEDLKYVLQRGGSVKFSVLSTKGATAFDTEARGNHC